MASRATRMVVPMVWGLILALPVVAGIIILAQGHSLGTWSFMGMTLLFLGAGIPVLARDRKRLLAERAAEEYQERTNRFRDLLREEFRSKTVGPVDIASLTIECGVTQEAADAVADEFYRRKVDRILANGVITPEDQRKLRLLAKALRIHLRPSTRDWRPRPDSGVQRSPNQSTAPSLPPQTTREEHPLR